MAFTKVSSISSFLIHSFIDSTVIQQLLSTSHVPDSFLGAKLLLISLLSVTFVVILIFSWEWRTSQMKSSYLQNILFPSLFSLLLSTCCSASPIQVHILFSFNIALSSLSTVFCFSPEWVLVKHVIENFKFWPQKCCSGFLIEEISHFLDMILSGYWQEILNFLLSHRTSVLGLESPVLTV